MSVRTTLTLDDDVDNRLRQTARETGLPFKEVANRALRRGLLSLEGNASTEPFVVKARPMEARPGLDFDDIGGLLEQLDGPGHR